MEQKDHQASGLKEKILPQSMPRSELGVETGWGHQILCFEKGEIDFLNDGYDPYPIVSSS